MLIISQYFTIQMLEERKGERTVEDSKSGKCFLVLVSLVPEVNNWKDLEGLENISIGSLRKTNSSFYLI